MKNIFKVLLIIISIILCLPIVKVRAADLTGYVTSSTQNLVIRSGPSASTESVKDGEGKNAVVKASGTVSILNTLDENPSDSACPSNKWYQISYNNYSGYICSDFITLNSQTDEEKPTQTSKSGVAANYNVIAYGTHKTEGRVAIVTPKSGNDDLSCTEYRIVLDNKVVCVASSVLTNITNVDILNTNNIFYDFETELAKFPDGYKNDLRAIHNLHPNWRFYAYNTGIEWNDVLQVEKNAGLIYTSTGQSYFDVYDGVNYDWKTNTFYAHESGVWYTPSKIATAYFLDPRTYLKINDLRSQDGGFDYKNLFVFEDSRAYTYQNDAVINKMLYYADIDGTFTDSAGNSISYYQAFTDGATFSKISASLLVARSRNETTTKAGTYTSGSVSGTFVNPDTNVSYAGYYNYFNVGAYGSSPITNGLIYAQKAGWNDRYKAIVEGSTFIGTKYIYNGQETQYFQKFNVSQNTLTGIFGHQYQTNIQAPITEASNVFWGYKDSGNIDQPIVFHIPVYNNMPTTESVKPHDGNPNNWLTDLKINGNTVSEFDGDNYYSNDDNWDGIDDNTYDNVYSYSVPWNQDYVMISATTAVDVSNPLIGVGQVNTTESCMHYVTVTADNGTTKKYAIKFIKQDAPDLNPDGSQIYPTINEILEKISVKFNDKNISGLKIGTDFSVLINAIKGKNELASVAINKNGNNQSNYFATGDKIEINSGNETKTFTYILYGDLNGDGSVDLIDLVNCRNIILGQSNLGSDNKTAADVNRDGVVDLIDLVTIRNSILGREITQ